MSFSALEKQAMQLALQQAALGRGNVHPNPMVGAVLLRDEQITGQAFHTAYGEPHAEAQLLNSLPVEQTTGSTLVVNLEPCNHQGQTPPCAPLIIRQGVARVVIATRDPNPDVAGDGVAFLRHHGVEVECGLLAEQAAQLNRGFLTRYQLGRPRVTLKIARTLDDCITPAGSTSGRITGDEARRDTHRLRAEHDAILVGVDTILNDDPQLNVRHAKGSDASAPIPVKIVLDQRLRIPEASAVVRQAQQEPLWMLTTSDVMHSEKAAQLRKQGVELFPLATEEDLLDPRAILALLLERGVNSVLIEGGARVYHSFVSAGLFDELIVYTAPWIAGDGLRLHEFNNRVDLELLHHSQLGNDTRTVYSLPEVNQRWHEYISRQED
jgi:diaminohydroxyphosphoribosylaminopyrimidine deaminase / 5-amino-6-(5-phosphoribosylamino)uracil reductase